MWYIELIGQDGQWLRNRDEKVSIWTDQAARRMEFECREDAVHMVQDLQCENSCSARVLEFV